MGCDGEYQSGCKDHNGRGFQLRIDKKRAEVRTTRRTVTSGRAAKRYASAQKQKKKEGNTLTFDTILSSTRRAALDTSGGPTILRVKEAAKVSEMCGCARQHCAGRTGKIVGA